MLKATLAYDKGTIVIRGLAHMPFATLDPRTNVLRAQTLYYSNIVEYLKNSNIEFNDYVFHDAIPSHDYNYHYNHDDTQQCQNADSEENMGIALRSPSISLRDYQKRSIIGLRQE